MRCTTCHACGWTESRQRRSLACDTTEGHGGHVTHHAVCAGVINKLQKCWKTPVLTCCQETRPSGIAPSAAATLPAVQTSTTKPLTATGHAHQKQRRTAPPSPDSDQQLRAAVSRCSSASWQPKAFFFCRHLRRRPPESDGADHPHSSSITPEALASACSANAPAPASSRNGACTSSSTAGINAGVTLPAQRRLTVSPPARPR